MVNLVVELIDRLSDGAECVEDLDHITRCGASLCEFFPKGVPGSEGDDRAACAPTYVRAFGDHASSFDLDGSALSEQTDVDVIVALMLCVEDSDSGVGRSCKLHGIGSGA